MNSKRIFYGMVGGIIIFIGLVISSVIFGDLYLQKQTAHLVDLKRDYKVLDEQQLALIQANKDIVKYTDLENIAKSIVPQDKDQAKVVREIINIAANSGVPIQYISFPSSSLGQASAKQTVVSPTDTTTPRIVTPPSQLKTVDGISGVYQMEITVQSATSNPINYQQLIDFLTKLENNRRTAQVSSISVIPDTKNRKLVTFSLVVNVYIKP